MSRLLEGRQTDLGERIVRFALEGRGAGSAEATTAALVRCAAEDQAAARQFLAQDV